MVVTARKPRVRMTRTDVVYSVAVFDRDEILGTCRAIYWKKFRVKSYDVEKIYGLNITLLLGKDKDAVESNAFI